MLQKKLILQIERIPSSKGEEWNILKEWKEISEIQVAFGVPHSLINQSLKKSYQGSGFWWMYKEDWDAGKRPGEGVQIRNKIVYAYNLEKDFIGKFGNAILAGRFLGISVSNIRLCAKGDIPKLRDYFFSYLPLKEEEETLDFTKVYF